MTVRPIEDSSFRVTHGEPPYECRFHGALCDRFNELMISETDEVLRGRANA